MKKDVSFKDRFQYRMDDLFSRGPAALIGALALFSLVIIVVAALVLTITGLTQEGGTPLTFGEAFWEAMMRTFDAGTMGGDTGWGFRLVMLFLPTIGGIFVISALIGVITNGLDSRLEELRKGRSRVIESGHTVILGWSEQVFTIISELVIANENQPKSCVVVMGQKDKVEMEEEIRSKVPETGKTRIVCRSGRPMEMADIEMVSINTAKSIVIVSPESDEPDSEVIKTVLAITPHPDRRSEPYDMVAEIRDLKNMAVAKVVGKDEVEWVLVGDLVARIIAQTCRQSGLSVVYTELFDFGGDEIYFKDVPEVVGCTFGQALACFETNALLGVMGADQQVRLNPPMDTVIQKGDQLILIAEDDDKIVYSSLGAKKAKLEAIVARPVSQPSPEQVLILGWNWRGRAILRELDSYMAPGSEVRVVADQEGIEEEIEACAKIPQHLDFAFDRGDITDREVLDGLDLPRYEHIILLCYSDTREPQQADAITLITLLHLRDIADRQKLNYSIVSEMIDIRNRNLADVTRADDFVVSDKLVSLMMAQISENRSLHAVFSDFFDTEGSEIYLKPAVDYVKPGQPVNFYTIIEAASRRGEVAFGYRVAADARDSHKAYGVHVNPPKSAELVFTAQDRVIVLAEDEFGS
jgi:voltage-gated potassium channel Kch